MRFIVFVVVLMFATSVYAREMTVDELAYYYANNPSGLIKQMNKQEEITIGNCRPIIEKMCTVMKRGALSDIQMLGVWDKYKGHMFLKYRDKWGDICMISIKAINPQEDMEIFGFKTQKNDVTKTIKWMYPKAQFYRVYKDNGFTYWKTVKL